MTQPGPARPTHGSPDRPTPAQALRLLQAEHRFRFRKSLGQHFLVDPRALDGIVRALAVEPGELVVEVGPGAGFLTERLLDAGARVVAIEVDPVMAALLERHTGAPPALTIMRRDVLECSLAEVLAAAGAARCKVAGNLPYQITSPVLFKFLEERGPVSRMVFTVQREVGDRMAARPGSRDYGALSVAVAYGAGCESVFGIAPSSFVPRPRVHSVVVRLVPHPRRLEPAQERALFRIVRAAFGQRRKMLFNAIAEAAGGREAAKDVLMRSGIDGKRRGETLSLEEFERLAGAAESQVDSGLPRTSTH